MKAKINLTNIGRFVKGMTLYFSTKLGINLVPRWKQEIIEWRKIIQKDECKIAGHCVECGCHSDGKLFVNAACDIGCYPEMRLSKASWEQFKKENTITFVESLKDSFRIYFSDATVIELPNSLKPKFDSIYSKTDLLNLKSLWC